MESIQTVAPADSGRTSLILVGIGGLLMTVSMFFRFVYGPMGASISYFGIIRHNLSWEDPRMLIPAWPVAFGIVEATVASLMLISPGKAGHRIHLVVATILLVAVAATQVVFPWWYGGITAFQRVQVMKSALLAACVVVALLIMLAAVHGTTRRSAAVTLLGAGWVLWGLYPVSEWTPLETILWAYGPGYWMLLWGTLCLIVGSVHQLMACRPRRIAEPCAAPDRGGMRERWAQICLKGPICFILLYGTLFFGGGFAIAALLGAYRHGILTWRMGLEGLASWLTGGSVFGLFLWLLKEREYRRPQR